MIQSPADAPAGGGRVFRAGIALLPQAWRRRLEPSHDPVGETYDAVFLATVTVGIALLGLLALKAGLYEVAGAAPLRSGLVYYLLAAAAAGLAAIDVTPARGAYRAVCGGTGLILAFGAGSAYLPYPVVDPDFTGFAGHFYLIGKAICVLCGLAAWWRPTLLLAAGSYHLLERELADEVTGIAIGTTDIAPVFETALVLGLVASVMVLRRRLAAVPDGYPAHVGRLAWITVVGMHLGNYFYSALAKMVLDGPPLAWVFENPTHLMIQNAWFNGRWLLADYPGLTEAIVSAYELVVIPSNAFVLLAQLFAVLAVFRLRWIVAITLVYDAMHLGIFLLSGVLFWKWILLNTVILLSCRSVDERHYGLPDKLAGLFFVIFGIVFVNTATLAWYNTPALVSQYYLAHTEDGRALRVPHGFFLNQSYPFSHGHFPTENGHFPTTSGGSVKSHALMTAAGECDLAGDLRDRGPKYQAYVDRMVAARVAFIRTHHDYFLGLSEDGRFNFLLYPFHHLTHWSQNAEFLDLDKRDITSYSIVVQSHCLGLEDAQLVTPEPYHETVIDIPLRRSDPGL